MLSKRTESLLEIVNKHSTTRRADRVLRPVAWRLPDNVRHERRQIRKRRAHTLDEAALAIGGGGGGSVA